MIYRAKLTEVKQLETNLTHEYVKNFIQENLGIGFNEDEDEIMKKKEIEKLLNCKQRLQSYKDLLTTTQLELLKLTMMIYHFN